MNFKCLGDFKFYENVPEEVIKKYEGRVPNELLEIWKKYGFGTFANGYMKIINPDDYMQVLEESYFASDIAIPIFATGLADIIVWQKEKYVCLIKYRKHQAPIYLSNFNNFIGNYIGNFNTPETIEYFDKKTIEFLDHSQYETAVKLLGELEYDECFGYVPLLALGGAEKPESLAKGKIKQHIQIITHLVGRME